MRQQRPGVDTNKASDEIPQSDVVPLGLIFLNNIFLYTCVLDYMSLQTHSIPSDALPGKSPWQRGGLTED